MKDNTAKKWTPRRLGQAAGGRGGGVFTCDGGFKNGCKWAIYKWLLQDILILKNGCQLVKTERIKPFTIIYNTVFLSQCWETQAQRSELRRP